MMQCKPPLSVTTRVAIAVGLAVASWTTCSAVAQSQPSEATTRPTQITPEAKLVLNRMTEAYLKLHTFETAGTVSIDMDAGGQKTAERTDITGTFQSPNQFRHDLKGQDTIVSNGERLYAYLNAKNTYLQLDAPASRADGIPEQIGEVLMDQDPSLLLTILPDAGGVLAHGASTVSKSADVSVDGKVYQALNIVTPMQDTQVLVDSETGLVRRMQHDLTRSMKARDVPNVNVALITVDYTKINVNPTLPTSRPTAGTMPTTAPAVATAFDWTPPADAKPMSAPPAGMDAAATQLEGKSAPAFTLNDIDGKAVSLASLKGQVVILDFWATYCEPCRQGLPIIDKIANARPNDVKVLAIDTGEDLESAKTGKKEMNLSMPVLVDGDGKVGELYGADHGIPDTIIIDKDGIVRKVLLGLAPNEQDLLNSEIDAANKPAAKPN